MRGGIMRKYIWVAIVVVALAGCGEEQPPSTKPGAAAPEQIKPSPKQVKLNPAQIKRLAAVQAVLSDVDPTSVKEYVSEVETDVDPDREIRCWEAVAAVYSRTVKKDWTKLKRGTLLQVLLSGTIGEKDAALKLLKPGTLTVDQAKAVLKELEAELKKRKAVMKT
jgi:hypothetical protein